MKTALVVGASGMLMPCVAWCSQRHDRVIATCNSSASALALSALAPNVVAVRADWTSPEQWWSRVAHAVGDMSISCAIVWMHAAGGHRDALRARISSIISPDGVLVHVHGHAAAAPKEGALARWFDAPQAPGSHDRHVVLGWQRDEPSRWLTSQEIGAGVLELAEGWLADGALLPVACVGVVRPWSSRPMGAR